VLKYRQLGGCNIHFLLSFRYIVRRYSNLQQPTVSVSTRCHSSKARNFETHQRKLEVGHHAFPFKLEIGSSLPSMITTDVLGGCWSRTKPLQALDVRFVPTSAGYNTSVHPPVILARCAQQTVDAGWVTRPAYITAHSCPFANVSPTPNHRVPRQQSAYYALTVLL
jgi:hypothetical protein